MHRIMTLGVPLAALSQTVKRLPRLAGSVLSLILACCGQAPLTQGNHWREVGALDNGSMRFVEVDAASAKDGNVYQEAASELCSDRCYQLGFFMAGYRLPPQQISGSKWMQAGGWGAYNPLAVYSNTNGGEFTKWDCERAGIEAAPLSALCGEGAQEQHSAVLRIASREGWFKGCGLPEADGRQVVEKFAVKLPAGQRAHLMAAFDEMYDHSLGGPDDPLACSYLREKIEGENQEARKLLSEYKVATSKN